MSKATFLKAAAVGLLSLSAVACYGPAYGPAPHRVDDTQGIGGPH